MVACVECRSTGGVKRMDVRDGVSILSLPTTEYSYILSDTQDRFYVSPTISPMRRLGNSDNRMYIAHDPFERALV